MYGRAFGKIMVRCFPERLSTQFVCMFFDCAARAYCTSSRHLGMPRGGSQDITATVRDVCCDGFVMCTVDCLSPAWYSFSKETADGDHMKITCLCVITSACLRLTGRGPPGPPPGSRVSSEPPRPAAAPKFGHLIVKCVKGIELKVRLCTFNC